VSGRNVAASIRARLLQKARAEQLDFNLLLTRFALERILYRLSVCEEKDQFLLKGALLFDIWFDVQHRPTHDADLLSLGSAHLPRLETLFRNICMLSVEDGIRYQADSVKATEIRKEANYAGVRVTLIGLLDGARCHVQVDIGFGDAVVPGPESADYPVILQDMPVPKLQVYPRYTVVAEKLEAMISLGMLNTRLKDFFDLWILARFSDLDGAVLAEAIHATFRRRGTSIPVGPPLCLSDEFSKHPQKALQWQGFQRKNALEPIEFAEVVGSLRSFLQPVLTALSAGDSFTQRWRAGEGWESP
jgi:hypothetical protein